MFRLNWLIITVLIPGIALTAVIRVPQDQQTIQDAVNAAQAGDTVLVADGEYTGQGNVNVIIRDPLNIVSVNGPGAVTIDCEEAENSRAFTVNIAANIIGFTITRATATGIWVENAAPVRILNCVFTDNSNTTHGGGMYWRASNGSITQTIFTGNNAVGSGGGMYAHSSTIVIDYCIFQENECTNFGGGMLFTQHTAATVRNCIIQNNASGSDGTGDGGGVAYSADGAGPFINNNVLNNTAGQDNGMGGGLYSGSNSFPRVANCIFWGNDAVVGNHIFVQDNNGGQIEVSHCCLENGVDDDGRYQGEEVIEDNPAFTEGPEAVWGLNTFFLDDESPCIDAGREEAAAIGMDTLSTQIDLSLDEGQVDIGFHYWRLSFHIVGRLFGRVVAADSEEPVPGAVVFTSLGQRAEVDDEGDWEIPEAWAFPFSITAVARGYNSLTFDDRELEEGGESEINFELTHPVFSPPEGALFTPININDTLEIDFQIANAGDGPLTWSVTEQLPEEVIVEDWTLRESLPVGEITGNNNLYAVAQVGDEFYVAGAAAEGANQIYVIREGEVISQFDQPAQSNFGIRDLAWDGDLLWGAVVRDIYGFTLDGRTVAQFRGPGNPTIGITWDPDRQWLWACDIGGDIIAYDREGRAHARIQPPDIRIYGLAFNPLKPNGFSLTAMIDPGDDPRMEIYWFNPQSGESAVVTRLSHGEGGRAGGIEISQTIDPYGAVLLSVPNVNENARLDLWQIDQRADWMSAAPREGILEADQAQDMVLTLASTGFLDGLYEGELVFNHDAFQGTTIVPFGMEVREGNAPAERSLDLVYGWNLVSLNIQPENNDIRVITQPLLEAGILLFAKDQFGHFFSPARNFYNMEGWEVEQAYWLKVNAAVRLQVAGMSVSSDEPLPLRQGWNAAAYYPRWAMEVTNAIAGIVDQLVLIKDGNGRFYLPAWDFNALGSCRQGFGYQICVLQDVELVWGARPGRALASAPPVLCNAPLKFYTAPAATGSDFSLAIFVPDIMSGEIGVHAGELLVGAGRIDAGRCAVIVRGDDPLTPVKEGAGEGDDLSLTWKNLDQPETVLPVGELLTGDLRFQTDGWAVVNAGSVVPDEFELLEVYPNPFNSRLTVEFRLSREAPVKTAIYDMSGRQVTCLDWGIFNAGTNRISWETEGLTSGMYICRISAMGRALTAKVILMK